MQASNPERRFDNSDKPKPITPEMLEQIMGPKVTEPPKSKRERW